MSLAPASESKEIGPSQVLSLCHSVVQPGTPDRRGKNVHLPISLLFPGQLCLKSLQYKTGIQTVLFQVSLKSPYDLLEDIFLRNKNATKLFTEAVRWKTGFGPGGVCVT